MNTHQSVEERARSEIVALHAFFQDWFQGVAKRDAFCRLEQALAPGFGLIDPDGRWQSRSVILNNVRTHHGTDPLAILKIQNVQARMLHDAWSVFTYEEWQGRQGAPLRGRISTVAFEHKPKNPNGLAWLHVHETWLADPDPL